MTAAARFAPAFRLGGSFHRTSLPGRRARPGGTGRPWSRVNESGRQTMPRFCANLTMLYNGFCQGSRQKVLPVLG